MGRATRSVGVTHQRSIIVDQAQRLRVVEVVLENSHEQANPRGASLCVLVLEVEHRVRIEERRGGRGGWFD